MKTRSKAILAAAGIALVVLGLVWPRDEPVYSLGVGFSRYAEVDGFNYQAQQPSKELCAYFNLTNTGNRPIQCRGVGASSEHQLTEILTTNGWRDPPKPWLSPGAAYFRLRPGEVREVPLMVWTNLPWKIGFRFRPRLSWESFRNEFPDYEEVWTDPVPAPGNFWPQP